jgi:predicted nucleic acid-binding protein
VSARRICDAGPLVALLSERDRFHRWAKEVFARVRPPVVTCEAVVAEAWHLLRGTGNGQAALLALLSGGGLVIQFSLAEELSAVRRLVSRYRDRPMSLADACLVRMSELLDEAAVVTIDEDFHVYRRHGRQAIALISPTR